MQTVEFAIKLWLLLSTLLIDLFWMTACWSLPLLLYCCVALTWLVRTYGARFVRCFSFLVRPATDLIQSVMIGCLCYTIFGRFAAHAFDLLHDIVTYDPQDLVVCVSLIKLVTLIAAMITHVFATAIGIYAVEANVTHTMPQDLAALAALRPLSGSISSLRQIVTVFSRHPHPHTAAKHFDIIPLGGEGDREPGTTDSDANSEDESELNKYDAWRGQPASTSRGASKRKQEESSVVKCDGPEELEHEE